MTAGDLITADWQIELAGLLMGDDTPYVVAAFDPWAAPTARVGEVNRAGADGVIAGVDLVGGRTVTVELLLASDDVADDLEAMRALTAAWAMADADVPLVWRETGGAMYRLEGRPRLADPRFSAGLPVECRFLATDPTIYANTEQTSGAVGFPTGGAGVTPPLTPPVVFGSGGSSGTFTATNDGTALVGWRVEVAGTWVDPVVENVDTGDQLRLVGSVGSGQTLVIDSTERSITLDGSARPSWLRAASQWWTLPPGDTEVRLTGASGAGSATFTWRSGWK